MPRFVVLLRGINVGKAKRVPMAEFRALLEGQGFTEIQTLLNSGNAVFSSTGRSALAHAGSIAASLVERFEFEVPVVVKTSSEFVSTVAECPFAAGAEDHSRLLVVFTQKRKALVSLSSLAPLVQPPEQFAIGKHAAHLHCAGGILESKLAKALLAKSGNIATSRNWATVLKINGLLRAGVA